jgi:hypothetical protein
MQPRAAAALLAVTVLTAASARVASAVEPGFSDAICPEATQYVLGVGKLRNGDPPEKIYPVAQAAVDAYARCSKDKLANGFREAQHYADTRGAGFAVVAARSLIAMKRYDDARRELELWRPLAQQVVDWKTETQAPYSAHRPDDMDPGPVASGADNRGSMYRAAAKDVVTAIDAALAQIDSVQRDVSRPQAQPSAPAVPHP